MNAEIDCRESSSAVIAGHRGVSNEMGNKLVD